MLKANVEDVNAWLDTKADITYVDTELSWKADLWVSYTKAEEDALLADKANSSDVTTALWTKADTTYVDNELAIKADIDYVNDLSSIKIFTYKDDLFRTSPFVYNDWPLFTFFQSWGVLSTNTNKAAFFSSTDIINWFYWFNYVTNQNAFTNESIWIWYKTTRTWSTNTNTLNLWSIKLYEIESRVKLLPYTHNNKRWEFRMWLWAWWIATNGWYLYTSNASTPATTAYFIRYIQTTWELWIHTRSWWSETFTVLATLDDTQASSLNTLRIRFVNVAWSVSISLIMNWTVLWSVSTDIDLTTWLDISIMYVLLYWATYTWTAWIAIDNILFTEWLNI